ncbi:alpha/beta fold hydrolase [Streptomyces exfoliatus]|uniref:alpha/beta fold hydrolase n=1 Tax=Streptomyces exfoliatus TaxID=1905 RepID=UPI003C2EA368
MLERQGPLLAWMRAAMRAADPHALAALTAALDARDGVLERLVQTPVPVLLLAGDRDPRLRSIQDTAARISGSTCVELSGCGHFDTFLRLDLALPVVRPFLARTRLGEPVKGGAKWCGARPYGEVPWDRTVPDGKGVLGGRPRSGRRKHGWAGTDLWCCGVPCSARSRWSATEGHWPG